MTDIIYVELLTRYFCFNMLFNLFITKILIGLLYITKN